MRTRVCDTFGIEFPIFAFSHCRDVVAAVSRAGGLGALGALAFPSSEALEVELRWIDEHVDGKPYGVDVVMPVSYEGAAEGGHDTKQRQLAGLAVHQAIPFAVHLSQDGRQGDAATCVLTTRLDASWSAS